MYTHADTQGSSHPPVFVDFASWVTSSADFQQNDLLAAWLAHLCFLQSSYGITTAELADRARCQVQPTMTR